MPRIKIIYGTGGGNTELVCERATEVFKEEGHTVTLVQAKTATPADMGGADLLILASPTYGHGLLEKYIGNLIAASGGVDLKGQKCAVVGLGNAMYDDDYFLEAGKILKKFIEDHGGTLVYEVLFVAKSPIPYLAEKVPEWARAVSSKLKNA